MVQKNSKLELDFQKLEDLVKEIESGEVGLEESLDKLKEGMQLSKEIKNRLNSIQSELETITQE